MLKKQDTSLAWRFHASPVTHNTRFAIKTFNLVQTYGGDMGTDGYRRALRKFVPSILQNILKHCPTYRTCDARKDFKAQFGVSLKYHKILWERNWHRTSFMDWQDTLMTPCGGTWFLNFIDTLIFLFKFIYYVHLN